MLEPNIMKRLFTTAMIVSAVVLFVLAPVDSANARVSWDVPEPVVELTDRAIVAVKEVWREVNEFFAFLFRSGEAPSQTANALSADDDTMPAVSPTEEPDASTDDASQEVVVAEPRPEASHGTGVDSSYTIQPVIERIIERVAVRSPATSRSPRAAPTSPAP